MRSGHEEKIILNGKKIRRTWTGEDYLYDLAVTNQYNTRFSGIPGQKDMYCLEGMLYKVELINLTEKYTKLFGSYEKAHEFFMKARFAGSISDALSK